MNDNLNNKLQKYEDLVKYVRIKPEHTHFDLIQDLIRRVESESFEEVKVLMDLKSDWQHGFNSGCLAILRYIQMTEELGVETADLEFPMLDT